MANYRQKKFDSSPIDKMFSNSFDVDAHHNNPQRKGGSDKPENITTLLKGFHQAFNTGKKRKKEDIIANVKSGIAEVIIENSKLLDKIKN